ncbi:MAG: hypothetical protein JNJ77_11660 [Planctomycetia bacterium]|nr:hypothetical protein [Planctomycetia bacterium]
MRNRIILSVTLLVCLLGILFAWNRSIHMDQKQRDAQWAKVNDAINKGLPQSAIKEIEPIIKSAIDEKAYPEAIKAIAKKIAYEAMVQGNKPEERITRMKAEIAKAPDEMKPVMESVLAQWYWHYFLQNRWRFMQRTATAAAPSEDFTTWDLSRLFKEIDSQFTKALSHEEKLKKIPIKDYDSLIDKGTLPDSYRPTLYDFLAFDALNFYGSGELAAAKAEDAFEFEANSPVLGSREAFLTWKPDTSDADSPKLKAIQLYQKLLQIHQNDDDGSALLDADLHRLRFGFAHAFGEEKNALYKKALKQFADENKQHELSALALATLAGVYQSENKLVEAREVAIQGKNQFPQSQGGINCHNIVVAIEQPHYQVQIERVWANPLAKLHVEYKNLTRLYFRIYQADWEKQLKRNVHSHPSQMDDNQRSEMLGHKPVAEWSVDLPATEDYQQRSEEVTPPDNLPAGFYFVVACPDNRFKINGLPLTQSHFWVSDLALVLRQEHYRGRLEGFVLNSNTGEPIVGARVTPYVRNYQQNRLDVGAELTTDKNGLFQYTGPSNQPVIFLAKSNGHAISNDNEMHRQGGGQIQQAFEQVIFFTDRSLYRPGQPIRFKGIALRGDNEKLNYQTLANRTITVQFNDPNGKEISKLQLVTNQVGSFSGSFTAPRDRLMGQMMIQATGPHGSSHFNVEEYKRPKFEVTVDAPKDSPKLNDAVKLTGKAMGYSGAAVSNAKLRYRITRQVRFPAWWGYYYWWRMPPNLGAAQEIAHGTATTEPDGTFSITFTAKPDPTVAEKDEPVFTYSASVDVTDTTGETRSGSRSLQVGYTALQASLTANEWQTSSEPVKLKIGTSTIDGQGTTAKGSLKVYQLKQPEKVMRAGLFGRPSPRPIRRAPGRPQPATSTQPTPDPADPRTWELGEQVATSEFTTTDKGELESPVKLGVGIYRAMLETQDRFGKPVKAMLQFQVVDPSAIKLALKIPHFFAAPKWQLEPGEEFSALWGTGYDSGKAYVEIEHRQNIISSFWTSGDKTQQLIKQAVNEQMRGGFNVRVTYVRENRVYTESRHVDVPWSNKELKVKWEHFVSKLEPGKKETWTAVITGPDAKKAVAEMAAACYDASLDAYLPHHWQQAINVFYQDRSYWSQQFQNYQLQMHHYVGMFPHQYRSGDFRYRAYPQDITVNLWQYGYLEAGQVMRVSSGRMAPGSPAPAMRAVAAGIAEGKADSAMSWGAERMNEKFDKRVPGEPVAPSVGPNLENVATRTNLNETAFFFPHLLADENGTVKLEFTMPEALTKWKFMGFAHDKELKSGYLEDTVVTAKDLMVQPNPPRFLREGDILEFTVKVSNQSATRQAGKVRLTLTDSRTGKSIDADLGNKDLDQAFDIASKESRSFSWKLSVPDNLGPITYKAVGATDRLSDGEEGMLPVLSRRVLVQESLPLPIRGKQDKILNFTKLLESGKSNTLQHQSLTVQMVSNPSWYAVMALPYLMEYPHECSEQTFNRFYANSLARHIALSDARIRKVFDQWKNTPALDSPLEKNQDLKAVMIEETPWLRQANKESESRRNVGILFDDNRLQDEMNRAFRKLSELQNATGAWSWFPGGPDSEYITLYITTGFGRMRHLGLKPDMAPALKSLNRLDAWMDRMYRDILRHDAANKDKNHLTSTVALYLYGRSFFVEDQKVADPYKEAFNYWLAQAKKYWLQLANRQSQAHLAIALKRWGDRETPQAIMNSIKERSVTNEELGRFWRDTELSYWWYHAPIETQALMIEAFDEVMNDAQAVEDCKVWLLKQKQTQNWKTTKSTADAVYSLLLRGDNLLASDALVEMSLAGTAIKPEKVEAGTGFYEQKFVRGEVKPEFGKIELKKTDAGVAWGSIHWQYLEDISKVTPHEGTPLKLQKQLFKRTYTKKGPVLEAVQGTVSVGDEIVVRIVLRTDRDMEFVHMKDHRGSGTEPTNVLSQYKYQDGLGYYESTKDTASHFFIDYLPKGTYVFEYAVRVQHQGKYPTGMAHIECMYAPEFNSHSESIMLEVK